MSGQEDVLQELINIVADVEAYDFVEIPTLKHYVIQFLKVAAVCRFHDGLSNETFLDVTESF